MTTTKKIDEGIWYGINTGAPYAARWAYGGTEDRIAVYLLHPNTLEELRLAGVVHPKMFAKNYRRHQGRWPDPEVR